MTATSAKKVAFITMMIVLGNVFSGISIYLGPIYPGVNLDFSHITTFIAAIYGGPVYGFIVGFFGGVWAGFYFGFIGGTLSWLSLLGLPVGKSLTGLATGLFYRIFRIREKSHASLITVPTILVSFIPETLFTVIYFLALAPYFFAFGFGMFMLGIILPKAWAEIVFMSFLMAALVGNQGFSTFVTSFLSTRATRTA
ncbi:MAG: ECF transporter S component [Candidatus Bathyarchaeia archaeon]|jgi:riboflavin transporter FmnP|nr:ECF transporter S component [Candidatus Bathyarchaeota archaeon A05DMB-4]MDH7594742.1 ECF transporter S component [Candidatus Bathyarchaeota archaeon]